jgi:integrase/recombinase XerD
MEKMNLIDSFIIDCKTRNLATNTQGVYRKNLRSFERAINVPLAEVSKDDLKNYLNDLRKRNLDHFTIAARFSALSSFYDYLVEEGFIAVNPVKAIRKRYLRTYKRLTKRRKIISIEEAAKLVNSVFDSRDRAILMLLFKTGLRITELLNSDIEDVDFEKNLIKLKPTPKRSNRIVFFDEEAAEALKSWLAWRNERLVKDKKALFISKKGHRLSYNSAAHMILKHAERVGLHNRSLDDIFTAHCCRHWFTTHLRKAGMPREFIQELRGDARREAIDIYDHIDLDELRESYIAYIPTLT